MQYQLLEQQIHKSWLVGLWPCNMYILLAFIWAGMGLHFLPCKQYSR